MQNLAAAKLKRRAQAGMAGDQVGEGLRECITIEWTIQPP